MAVLAYARKTEETDQSVRYLFGGDPGELTRVVVFDKATKRPDIEDGLVNPLATGACTATIRRLSTTGAWPDSVMHAS